MAGFTVTTASTEVKLGVNRQARVKFTFTNTAHRNLTARITVLTKDESEASWYKPDPEQTAAPVDSTQEVTVTINVAAKAPAGAHLFAVRVVGIENTDEFTADSQWLTLQIDPVVADRRWMYALIAVAAVVLIGAVGFVAFKVLHKDVAGNVQVEASVTDFGTVEVGHSGKISVVTLSNVGSADSAVNMSLVGAQPGDFQPAFGSCQGATIKAGGTCQFALAFQPTAQGARKATLQVAATNGQVTLDLSGTGQGVATLTFNPKAVSISASAQTVTVTNTGTGEFAVTQMIVSDQATFKLGFNSCQGAKLAPGATCQFVVSTTYSGFPKSGSLVLVGNPGGTQTLAMTAGFFKVIAVDPCFTNCKAFPGNFIIPTTPKQ